MLTFILILKNVVYLYFVLKTSGPALLDKTGAPLSCHSKWVDLDGCLAGAASYNATSGMVPLGTKCEAECLNSRQEVRTATFECDVLHSPGPAIWRGTLKCPQSTSDDTANDGAVLDPDKGTTWRYPRTLNDNEDDLPPEVVKFFIPAGHVRFG